MFAILFFGIVTQYLLGWPLLKFSNILGDLVYPDLSSSVKSAQCTQATWSNSFLKPNFIFNDCGYIYGHISAIFLKNLTTPESTEMFGFLQGLLVVLLLAILISKEFSRKSRFRFQDKFFILFSGLSPVIMLLIQRGNLDGLVFLLIILAAWLTSKNKTLLGFLMVVIATLAKFYTAPLLIYFILLKVELRLKLLFYSISFFTMLEIFLEINSIHVLIPRSDASSFGLWVLPMNLSRISTNFRVEIYMLLFVSIILVFSLMFRNQLIHFTRQNLKCRKANFNDVLFSFTSAITITCFFTGTNFDYRLVFLIVSGMLYISRLESQSTWDLILGLLLFLASWFSFQTGYFQPIGDLAITIWIVIFSFEWLIKAKALHYGFATKTKNVNTPD